MGSYFKAIMTKELVPYPLSAGSNSGEHSTVAM